MIKGRISFVMLERRCYTPMTSIDTFPFSSPKSFILPRLDTFERFQERSRHSDVRGVNSGPPLDDDFTVEGRSTIPVALVTRPFSKIVKDKKKKNRPPIQDPKILIGRKPSVVKHRLFFSDPTALFQVKTLFVVKPFLTFYTITNLNASEDLTCTLKVVSCKIHTELFRIIFQSIRG